VHSLPSITVITPCLNAVDTVERTIESVLGQDYRELQYLVIDGKSSDGTQEILRRYEDRDERMTVVSRSDNSMTEALNRGLHMAEGTIIGSLNADDWYEDGALQKVGKRHRRDPFACIVGNTRYVRENGNVMYIRRPWLSAWPAAWHLMGCLTPESSVFYTAECVRTVGSFSEKYQYTQDLDFYLRVMEYYTIQHVDHTLSNFWVAENQISVRLHDTMEEEVRSYINHKSLRRWVGGTPLASILQILTGQRVYRLKQFGRHVANYVWTHLLDNVGEPQ
jgi:glycosyltransferase involved in cell wall biosynthesis